MRRLFFAFWPDDPVRAAMAAARQRMFPLVGRPVEIGNLHLTAAFLGAVADERVPALQALGMAVPSCRIDFDRVELWGKQKLLVACASHPPEPLKQSVDLLWQRLQRLGFVRDPRPFKPHVTLVRDVQSMRPGVPWLPVSWTCERLQLIESTPGTTGVVYTPLT